jgi:hypothetical protein
MLLWLPSATWCRWDQASLLVYAGPCKIRQEHLRILICSPNTCSLTLAETLLIAMFEDILMITPLTSFPSRMIEGDLILCNRNNFPQTYHNLMHVGPAIISQFYIESRFQTEFRDWPDGNVIPHFHGDSHT